MKYGKFIIIIVPAVLLACMMLASCKKQSPAEPGVTVKHDSGVPEIFFTGYNAQVWYDTMSVLPLTDDSFLVGIVAHDNNTTPATYTPMFFRFDSEWNFISQVPFDAEDFLSGDEARRRYSGDSAYVDYAAGKITHRYEFKINTVTPDFNRENASDGRLRMAPTDYGVVTQIIDFTGTDTIKLALAKCYYYDHADGTVKLREMYQLDGVFSAEASRLDLITIGSSYLLHGAREVDGSTESFYVLFNKNSVLRGESWGSDKYSYEKMKIWQGVDKCLIAPPFSERYPSSPEFKLYYSNGRIIYFQAVPLPEGYDLGIARYNEDRGALEFLMGNGRAAALDENSDWADIEPFTPELIPSNHTYFYRLSAEETKDGVKLKADYSPYTRPCYSLYYDFVM